MHTFRRWGIGFLLSGSLLINFSPQVLAQEKLSGPIRSRTLRASDLQLSEEALSQIQALSLSKAQRTPTQRKIDSSLLYAAKMRRGEPIAAGVNKLETNLETDMIGRTKVDIDAVVTDNLLETIRQSGGDIQAVFPHSNFIQVIYPIDNVEWLASLPEIINIRRAAEATTNTGSVLSEAENVHQSGGTTGARSTYNTTGSGLLVGVLSNDNVYRPNSQVTGDLPPSSGPEPTVKDLPGQTGSATGNDGDSEGTAMLELIHDVAPGAGLRFATAFSGDVAFAQNIRDLATAGCSIIVDDVFYFNEPPFSDGIIAKAVDEVTAQGVLYFSSAGNQGNTSHPGFASIGLPANTSSVWEGDFVDGGSTGTTGALANAGKYHRFSSGTTGLYNTARGNSARVYLYWSDPQGASSNDYDLYITDSTGSTVVAASTRDQTGTQSPIENTRISTNQRAYVILFSGSPRMLHLSGNSADVFGGFWSFNTAGQTKGHSGARNAFCVAALPATNDNGLFGGPNPNPFTTSSPFEYFSSDGPRRVHFLNDGTPITPGNFSTTGGEVRLKPDLAAADGVQTSVPGFQPFYGTSAAAPNAAAIAALVKSYKSANAPSAAAVPEGVTIDGIKFTATEMRQILVAGCIDNTRFGNPVGWDKNTGYGALMPKKALAFVTNFVNPNLISANTTSTTATIQWTSSLTADSIVQYGTSPNSLTQQAIAASGTAHTVVISGLTPSTAYYYRVISKTGTTNANSGAIFVSPIRSVVTSSANNFPQVNTSGVAISGSRPNITIQLGLRNSGSASASSVQITSATLAGVSTTTSLPTTTITLPIGGTTTIPLAFTGVTAGVKMLNIRGTFTGGGFNLSLRVTVP